MDIFQNPALVQAAIEQEKEKRRFQQTGGDPLLMLARSGGEQVGGALGNLMGRRQEDPRIAQVKLARKAVEGIDMTNPEGMMDAARKLNEAGLTNEAVQLATKAKEINQADLIAAAQFNNSIPGQKDDTTTLEKQYEFIKKTAGKDAADKFLLSKQGSGQNITINTGDNVPLTTSQEGKTQGKIIDTQDQITRVEDLDGLFKSEYQEIPSKIGFKWSELKEKFGVDLSEKDEVALEDYAKFRNDAYNNLNRYIKFITGAQMSEKEANRLRRAIPDPGDGIFDGDSPTVFKAKLQRQRRTLNASDMRYKTLLKLGIDVSDVERMAKDGSIDKYKITDFENAYDAIEEGRDPDLVMKTLEEHYGP